jgi:hypothetical protein
MNRLPLLLLSALFLNPVPLCATTGDELTEAQRRQLAQDKILIGTEEFLQSFEPYIRNDVPIFVTSDAVLNAFHVLFEESLTRMEAANLPKLETFLEKILTKLPEAAAELKGVPDTTRQGAVERAEIMMKTAFRLLGRPAAGSNAGIEQTIAAQVKEIEAATGSRKPEWLGPPDPGFLALDFTRYTPRGFYADSILLQRYFRSVSWLQSVPFRVLRDEEYLAAKVIGRAAWLADPADALAYDRLDSFLHAWKVLLGEGDDYSLTNLVRQGQSAGSLDFLWGKGFREQQQSEITDRLKQEKPQINDTLRIEPGHSARVADPNQGPEHRSPDNTSPKTEPQFRILSAAALPDAVLFQSSGESRRGTPLVYPSPLEVAAGMGSVFAKTSLAGELPPAVWPKVETSIQRLAGRKTGDSIYDEYLGVLHEMVNSPDPGAPDFMRSQPWERKSCQSLLSSWTQMRHSFVLQAKMDRAAGCATHFPTGIVEPDPEFFRHLGALTARCHTTFAAGGAFDDDTEFLILSDLKRGREVAALATLKSWDQLDQNAFNDIDRASERAKHVVTFPKSPGVTLFPDGLGSAVHKGYEPLWVAYFGKLHDAFEEAVINLEKSSPAAKVDLLKKCALRRGKPWQLGGVR